MEFPRGLFPRPLFRDSPSTSSFGKSPDANTEYPLFVSIRPVLSADPSYTVEDIFTAIEMRSDGKTCAVPRSGSEPAIIASLISEATARQEVTSHETRKRPARTSGRSKSPANKKQKTCTSSAADGDDEDGSRSNSGVGEDGDDQGSDEDGGDSSAGGDDIYGYSGDEGDGGGDGTPPRHSPDEPSDSWICPYCLRYVEITCIKRFETCGRPGFSSRDQLR